MSDAGDRCPRCGGPTTVYYDHRNTWAVCVPCRVGRWVGTGYDHDAEDPSYRAPAGAVRTRARFWEEVA